MVTAASRDVVVALLISVAACGEPEVAAPDAGGDDGGAGALSLEMAEVLATDEPIADVVALDGGGFAVITIVRDGDTDRLVLTRHDDGGVAGPPIALRAYVRPSADDGFGSVDSAVLDGGAIAMVWTLCAGPPALSCTAEYATISVDGVVSAPVVLYDRIYGEVRIAAHRGLAQVLVLRTTTLDVRAGAAAMILDDRGAVVRGWTRVGSSAARWGVAGATAAGFLVAVEDRYPDADEPECPPCTTLVPDCVSLPPGCARGEVEAAAGIHARELTATGVVALAPIASSWTGDRYREPAYLSLSTAGRPALAEWSFGDRSHHLYVGGDDAAWAVAEVALDDRAPRWTAISADAAGATLWLAAVAVLGPTLADTRSHLIGAVLGPDGVATATTAETLTGFTFAGTASFHGDGSAVVAAGIIGPRADWVGYDHYAIVRARWVRQSPNQ